MLSISSLFAGVTLVWVGVSSFGRAPLCGSIFLVLSFPFIGNS